MTRDAKKQSVKCSGRHDWIVAGFSSLKPDGQICCSLCNHFVTEKEREQAEATIRLKSWVKPGDTLHTQICTVSRSGMSRVIQVVKISCGEDGQPKLSYLGFNIALVLDWKYDRDREGVKVGGCGMDMGFHLVHSLGYALYGRFAAEGKGKAANDLRRALLKADEFYYTQGGAPKPNPNKPDRLWFGGAGYALKQRWL